MPTVERYRELLRNAQQASATHLSAYEAARSKYGSNKKGHEATTHELAEHFRSLGLLYEALAPAEKRFLAGDVNACDDIINFLEADIPVSRSGYKKEKFYRKLKSVKLDRGQVTRLQGIAIARCASTEQRREDSELRRLMIRLADTEFLRRIADVPDEAGARVRHKKSLMIEVVLEGRKDLRTKLKSPK
ncbi:MAG TPA: hypothetical protein VGJ06_10600 [Candidatus Acidoferrum sp.]|jgi:hypothetical protein